MMVHKVKKYIIITKTDKNKVTSDRGGVKKKKKGKGVDNMKMYIYTCTNMKQIIF